MSDISEVPSFQANVAEPYCPPILKAVHFNNEQAPYEILQAMGVEADDIANWRVYGGLPAPDYAARPKEVVINAPELGRQLPSHHPDIFREFTATHIAVSLAQAVVTQERPELYTQIKGGVLFGAMGGLLVASQLPVPPVALAVLPAFGAGLGTVPECWRESRAKNVTEKRVNAFLQNHPVLFKELRDTILPVYAR